MFSRLTIYNILVKHVRVLTSVNYNIIQVFSKDQGSKNFDLIMASWEITEDFLKTTSRVETLSYQSSRQFIEELLRR